jgi:hypothetical protein
MFLARLVVTAVRVEGRSNSAVAREYQVSRRWVHELVRRFDTEGEAGLAPRSRRPHHSPARTAEGVGFEPTETISRLSGFQEPSRNVRDQRKRGCGRVRRHAAGTPRGR